jgi:hypothetical protein
VTASRKLLLGVGLIGVVWAVAEYRVSPPFSIGLACLSIINIALALLRNPPFQVASERIQEAGFRPWVGPTLGVCVFIGMAALTVTQSVLAFRSNRTLDGTKFAVASVILVPCAAWWVALWVWALMKSRGLENRFVRGFDHSLKTASTRIRGMLGRDSRRNNPD